MPECLSTTYMRASLHQASIAGHSLISVAHISSKRRHHFAATASVAPDVMPLRLFQTGNASLLIHHMRSHGQKVGTCQFMQDAFGSTSFPGSFCPDLKFLDHGNSRWGQSTESARLEEQTHFFGIKASQQTTTTNLVTASRNSRSPCESTGGFPQLSIGAERAGNGMGKGAFGGVPDIKQAVYAMPGEHAARERQSICTMNAKVP